MNKRYTEEKSTNNYPIFDAEPLDEEERLDMETVESMEFMTNKDNPAYKQYKEKLRASSRKISINVQNGDIEAIQKIAQQSGIPYQTLISSVLHRYATGQIKIKKAF